MVVWVIVWFVLVNLLFSVNHLQNITQKTKDWPTRTQLSLKQTSTKHYTVNKRLTNTNPTITQTTIYKTLHSKQKIDQHEPNYHSNNHLQNTTQKTKDWPTQTQLSLKQPSTKHYTEKCWSIFSFLCSVL